MYLEDGKNVLQLRFTNVCADEIPGRLIIPAKNGEIVNEAQMV